MEINMNGWLNKYDDDMNVYEWMNWLGCVWW